ncbi:MAG: hypothetical protein GX326_05355 [Clostridiaceae bacterium]|nr:hypothetical protein [Clostridiaceae bacterium]
MEQTDFGVKLEAIAHNSVGYFGDPEGFEEILYKTKSPRSYLVVGKGGHSSKYANTEIRELTKRQAQDYLIEVKGEEEAYNIIPLDKKPATKKAAPKKTAAKKTTTKKTKK